MSAIDITPQSFEKKKSEGTFSLVAPRADQPPVIDGNLNDPCWDKATAVKSFWKAGTVEMAEKQTIAWVCFDAGNLYIAFACQDSKLTASQFNRDDNGIWNNDCVEVFLSPERSVEQERQFILGAGGSRWDGWRASKKGRFGLEWNPVPDWEGAVKQQPWGYTAEIRIPLDSLVDTKEYPVERGTVWGLKLTREDFGEHKGCRTSSWTQLGASTSDEYALGRLIVEDPNLYSNGNAAQLDEKGAIASWRVTFQDCDATLTQVKNPGTKEKYVARLEVKPVKDSGYYNLWVGTFHATRQLVDTTFFFTADLKVDRPENSQFYGVFRMTQDGKYLPMEQIDQAKPNTGWQKVRLAQTVKAGESPQPPDLTGSADGGGVIYLDNVRFEVGSAEMLEADASAWCLTGNAKGPLATRNRRVERGSYTYTDALTTAPMFPRKSMHTACDEPGWYAGWIPFPQGKLTDGVMATFVGWPLLWQGHQGQDITFDMGQEYEISRVDLINGSVNMRGLSLYLKSPDEGRYALVDTKCDLVQFDAKGYGEKTARVRFDNVNQPARWVRIQVPNFGYDVLAEVQIWGRDIEKNKKSARRPYLQSKGAAPIKDPKDFPVELKDIPLIYPTPRQMKLAGPALQLSDGMAIAYEPADSPRAKITAEILAEEMLNNYGLKFKVQPATTGAENAILVGAAANLPLTAKSLSAAKRALSASSALPWWKRLWSCPRGEDISLELSASSPGPEGYVLFSSGKQAVIGGCDAAGVFYGCQSLLTMVRRNADGKWEIPGAVIRDWPATKYRMLMGRPAPSRELIRTLARFRINYYQFPTRLIRQAANFDSLAEKYFVNFVPNMDPGPIVLGADQELTERGAEEKLSSMGVGRRVECPSNPKTWEIYFAFLDEWLPKFHSDRVQIQFDERYQAANGARWNVCPLCRARNLTAPQLLADTINKIDKKLKQYGKKTVMYDTCLMTAHKLSYPGDPDPQWYKALDAIPNDILFGIWHPDNVNELFKSKGFEQVYMPLDDKDWRKFDFPGKYYSGMIYYMEDGVFKVGNALAESLVTWNPEALRPHDPKADDIITVYAALWLKLHEGENLPSLVAGPTDFVPVDINKAANRSRIDEKPYDGQGWVDIGANCDLRALQSGLRIMGGIPFQIIDEKRNGGKGFVMLHNRGFVDRTMPEQAAIETGNLKAASLIFLHCLENRPGQNYLRRTELAGYLFMIYEDGTYSSHELKYAVNTANWDGLPTHWAYSSQGQAMKKGRLVWKGQTMSGQEAFLYASEWTNPRPDLAIQKIIFQAAYSISGMNPMLMAVTAVKPDPQLARIDTNAPLKKAAALENVRPIGKPLDLRGGKDESEQKYIAPDGTTIEGSSIDNRRSDQAIIGGEDFRSWIGIVNYDGNEYYRQLGNEAVVTYAFPQPRTLSGLMITGAYRNERKTEDFPPTREEYSVETDAGDGWKAVAKLGPVSPEATGPAWIALDNKPIQKLRITVKDLSNYHIPGICNVTLYAP